MEIMLDIISGFLGAGKTTLIKKLLEDKSDLQKWVIIENEFGEVGIDGIILKRSGIDIKEINSGCICCSLAGDFETSIQEVVHKFKPDRIIIEPSGVGKLSEVLKACAAPAICKLVQVSRVITVVDTLKCALYLANFPEFYENQIRNARTIILSRTQKSTNDDLQTTVNSIRELNSGARIITTPWEILTAGQIIAVAEQSIDAFAEDLAAKQANESAVYSHGHNCECGHCHNKEHKHFADEAFDVWSLETPKRFDESRLRDVFAQLQASTEFGLILRAKGILQTETGKWHQFDYVPGELEFKDAGPQYSGRMCMIGSGICKDRLERLFNT
jgi:G3E family GTPase